MLFSIGHYAAADKACQPPEYGALWLIVRQLCKLQQLTVTAGAGWPWAR
ncbi:hypothetical protein [Pelovirga terrestris]|nr:hypothetical protein [Pelovirga terrestris]